MPVLSINLRTSTWILKRLTPTSTKTQGRLALLNMSHIFLMMASSTSASTSGCDTILAMYSCVSGTFRGEAGIWATARTCQHASSGQAKYTPRIMSVGSAR